MGGWCFLWAVHTFVEKEHHKNAPFVCWQKVVGLVVLGPPSQANA